MSKQNPHVCPWYLGYFLLNPFRKLRHDPKILFGSDIKPGMKVLDYGPGMGYFSIPLARMVGNEGTVYCVDLQKKMLQALMKRARKAAVDKNIRPLIVGETFNPGELAHSVDFALLFAVVHEVPDQAQLFRDLSSMLVPGGKVFFAEPKGHVSRSDYEHSISLAQGAGLKLAQRKDLAREHGAILVR